MSLLKLKNIKFCIAPYEADSQISKMFNLGLVDAVITEDSDLVVYGVDVILKLKETGQCDFLSLKQDQD
jgi:exonuclease-1